MQYTTQIRANNIGIPRSRNTDISLNFSIPHIFFRKFSARLRCAWSPVFDLIVRSVRLRFVFLQSYSKLKHIYMNTFYFILTFNHFYHKIPFKIPFVPRSCTNTNFDLAYTEIPQWYAGLEALPQIHSYFTIPSLVCNFIHFLHETLNFKAISYFKLNIKLGVFS